MISRVFNALANLPLRWQRRTAGRYRPEVDGLRFFAIAIVVVGHMTERIAKLDHRPRSGFSESLVHFFSNPGLGVLLFFAVSGFILTSQYLNQSLSPISPAFLSKYFRRRLLRIEPPYFILLVATYLLITLSHTVPAGTNRFNLPPASLTTSLFASIFYTHGWLFGTDPKLFPPGWSLEVEVQFYLLAPLFFFLVFAIRSRAVRTSAGFLLLLSHGLVHVPRESDFPVGSAPHLYFTLLRWIPYFWLGILAADYRPLVEKHSVRPWLGSVVGWSGTAILVCGSLYGAYFNQLQLMCVVATAILMMFFGCFTPGSGYKAFLAKPWTATVGGACYSVYLTHLPVVQATAVLVLKLHFLHSFTSAVLSTLAIGLPLVLCVSLTFYVWIERFFMLPDWPAVLRNAVASRLRGTPSPFRQKIELFKPANAQLEVESSPAGEP